MSYDESMNIEQFLKDHSITYTKFDHSAVFTCEESEKLPPMPGAHTKNLVLRDEKKTRYFLVVVGHDKKADLKELRKILGTSGLSFASPEDLLKYLGVTPGSATLLGLVFDTDHKVELIIDEPIWNAELYACHPLINTATVVIPHEGIETFLKATGHTPRILLVPSRSTES